MTLEIRLEPADSDVARALIDELEAVLSPQYPSESRHGYRVDKLLSEGVHFVVAWADGQPAGCGGIQLFDDYGELKRMYVRPEFRGLGLGRAMIDHLGAVAADRGITILRLETGVHQFEAIRLYERTGFQRRGPFGSYRDDPLSLFFERILP